MAKIAFYQKYRSSRFDEVIGQEYIVKTIQNAVDQDQIGHAYLFCGPRGTGKTTMARLLAKAVNCTGEQEKPCEHCDNCLAAIEGTHPDIIEINAANETHIEDVRDLIDKAQLAPMMGKYKIYIIDEVHQLSTAASSALLKTLEEPPANVIFILATTDPQKLLPTVISRCQRFDFTKIPTIKIQQHLLDIAKKEQIELQEEAAEMIAALADGGMRDALSIFDQVYAYAGNTISLEHVDFIYGLTSKKERIHFLNAVYHSDITTVLNKIEHYQQDGIDFVKMVDGLIDLLKDRYIYVMTKKTDQLRFLTKTEVSEIEVGSKQAMEMMELLFHHKEAFKTAVRASSCFEMICLLLMKNSDLNQSHEFVEKKSVQPELKKEEQKEEVVSKPVKEEPIQEVEKEDVSRETVTNIFDPDFYLGLFQTCTKEYKRQDHEIFHEMVQDISMEGRKYSSALKGTDIGGSGPDAIILVCKDESIASWINDPLFNEQLYMYMKQKYDFHKMIYAVEVNVYQTLTKQFMEKRKAGTLPPVPTITPYSLKENHEKTPEQKVIELFGDAVEIIGE